MRLWEVNGGRELFNWDAHQPARACAFGNIDEHLACYSTDPFSTRDPSLRFVRIAEVPEESEQEPTVQIDLERSQRCASPKVELDTQRLRSGSARPDCAAGALYS